MAGLDSFHQKVGKWLKSLSCSKDEDQDEWKPVIGKPFDFRREDPCIAGLSSEEQEALRIRAVSDATRMFATLQPISHNGRLNKSSRTTVPSSPKTSTIPSPKTSTPSTFKSSFSTPSKLSSTTSKPSFTPSKPPSSTTESPTPHKATPFSKPTPSGKSTPSNAKVAKNKWITNASILGNSDLTYTLSPSLLEPNRPSLPRQNSSHSGKGGGGIGGKCIRPLALITDGEIINGRDGGRDGGGELGRNGERDMTPSRGGITSPSPKTAGYASLHTISTTRLDTGRTPLLEQNAITSPFDLQIPGPEAGRRSSHGHGHGQYQMNLLPSPVSSRMEGLDFDFGSFSGQGGLGHDGRKGSGFAHDGNEEVFAHGDGKADRDADHDQDRDSGKYVRGR